MQHNDVVEKKARLKNLFRDDNPKYDPFSVGNAAASYKKIADIDIDVIVPFICENPQYARSFLAVRPQAFTSAITKALTGGEARNFREELFGKNPQGVMWVEELVKTGDKSIFDVLREEKISTSKHFPKDYGLKWSYLQSIFEKVHSEENENLTLMDWVWLNNKDNKDVLKAVILGHTKKNPDYFFGKNDKGVEKFHQSATDFLKEIKSDDLRAQMQNLMLLYKYRTYHLPVKEEVSVRDAQAKIEAEDQLNAVMSSRKPGEKSVEVLFKYLMDAQKGKEFNDRLALFKKADKSYTMQIGSYLQEGAVNPDRYRDFLLKNAASFNIFLGVLFTNATVVQRFTKAMMEDLLLGKPPLDLQKAYAGVDVSFLFNQHAIRVMPNAFIEAFAKSDPKEVASRILGSSDSLVLLKAFFICKDAPEIKNDAKLKPLIELMEMLHKFKIEGKNNLFNAQKVAFLKKPTEKLDDQVMADMLQSAGEYLFELRKLKTILTKNEFKDFIDNVDNNASIKRLIACPNDVNVSDFINDHLKTLEESSNIKKYADDKAQIKNDPNDPAALNLLVYPEKNTRKTLAEDEALVIGDLHANALKAVKILLMHSVIDMDKNDYNRFIELHETPAVFFDKKMKQEFDAILDRMVITNPKAAIDLIGDLLADRNGNDYFVLKLLERLNKDGIKPAIYWSNHDVIFMQGLKLLNDPVLPTLLSKEQDKSLQNLHTLVHSDVVSLEEINGIVDNVYKPCLRLIDVTVEGGKIKDWTSHASTGMDTLMDLAEQFNIPFQGGDDLHVFVAELNKYVAEHIDELVANCRTTSDINTLSARKANPFEAVFWNRSYDAYLIRPAERTRHGHDMGEGAKRPGTVRCVDNEWAKSKDNYIVAVGEAGFIVVKRRALLKRLEGKRDLGFKPVEAKRFSDESSNSAPVKVKRSTEEPSSSPPPVEAKRSTDVPSSSAPVEPVRARRDAKGKDKMTAGSAASAVAAQQSKDKEPSAVPSIETIKIDYAVIKEQKVALSKLPARLDVKEAKYDELINLHENYLKNLTANDRPNPASEKRAGIDKIDAHIKTEKKEYMDQVIVKEPGNPLKISKILALLELKHMMMTYPNKSVSDLLSEVKGRLRSEANIGPGTVFQATTGNLVDTLIANEKKASGPNVGMFGKVARPLPVPPVPTSKAEPEKKEEDEKQKSPDSPRH